MIIKKFQASTETEAILKARDELGKNAVVMNIKTITPRGIYRLFRKPVVEVTAAVDEGKNYNTEKKEESIKEHPQLLYDTPKSERVETIPEYRQKDTSTIETRLNNLQSILEKQLTQNQEGKEIIRDREEKENEEQPNLSFLQLLYNQMVKNEVDEQFANQIIGDIEGKLKKDIPVDQVLSIVYQKIILKLGRPMTIETQEGKRKFIFFIGSTGVGKTTTIVKIASNLKMKQKLKVALVTADTYRIAAVEQLRTYANILGLPLHVIYSEEELQDVMEEFSDYDVVLVDTAGRSHRNREQRDDLESLIHKIPEEEREVYLVLSATTKYRDLIRITEIYSEITEYRLIFTKLDETGNIGNIFNIRMLTGAPLSYVAFGQNVPDDIEPINPQSIAKQILGGNE